MNKSFHFVPSHKKDWMTSPLIHMADNLVFDLEDGVPDHLKQEGRNNIESHFLNLKKSGHDKVWIRTNKIGTKNCAYDIDLIKNLNITRIMLPKVEDDKIIQEFSKSICDEDLQLFALIESFQGLKELNTILQLPQIWGAGLGLEDLYSQSVRLSKELSGLTLMIKSTFALACKMHHKIAVDTVFTNTTDRQGLSNVSTEAASLGFDGKFSIHPDQLDSINQAFTVSDDATQWASKILLATEGELQGGYSSKTSMVIGPPSVKKAKAIVRFKGITNE